MTRCSNKFSPILATLLATALVSSCVRDRSDLIVVDDTVKVVNRIEVDNSYLERQQAYLQYCSDNSGPENDGSIYGQVCRVYTGQTTYNEEEIQKFVDKLTAREDTSDFQMNAFVRLLYLDRETHALPDHLRTAIEQTVLNFKYWLDEPGGDNMCWWSENHQILFHTAELLAGQLFPDEVFPNSGMTGREHIAHALPLLRKWLGYRGRFGFVEFHSNVYFNEDMPPLVNLVDFAEQPEIALQAAMALDLLAFDFVNQYFQGLFATTHGRTYPSRTLDGLSDSTTEAAHIMADLIRPQSYDEFERANFTGAFLATSDKYRTPSILQQIAADAYDNHENFQRDSITFAEGPVFGIGYTDFEDVMFWWGMTGYIAPEIIRASFDMIEYYNLWEGFIFGEIFFLRGVVGTPKLEAVAEKYAPMTRGVSLEAVGTYTYRTPHYQLSGAQDYKKANWTAQVHAWQATIDKDSYVFTSYPGGIAGDYMGGDWTGGWLPRGTMYHNVGIFQYQRPELELLDDVLFVDYSHAYFPKTTFDEFEETDHWKIGKKGDAYVALYSEHPPEWSEDNDYELIAEAKENVWIIELGDADNSGTFAEFVDAIESSNIEFGDTVVYQSPSQGRVEVGWEGPMTVGGAEVDLGPYERFENKYCTQQVGGSRTNITFNGVSLLLDFEKYRRIQR